MVLVCLASQACYLNCFISLQILWDNRKQGDKGNDCLVSVDCTDCKIGLQKANILSFNTHKFPGSGLRYEIAVCILTGHIVWMMGPFPPGDWPDIEIFTFALKLMLDPFERVEADDGYRGEDPTSAKVPASKVHNQDERYVRMRKEVHSRHEQLNNRIKDYNILDQKFKAKDILFQGQSFRACVVLTQLKINNGMKV